MLSPNKKWNFKKNLQWNDENMIMLTIKHVEMN